MGVCLWGVGLQDQCLLKLLSGWRHLDVMASLQHLLTLDEVVHTIHHCLHQLDLKSLHQISKHERTLTSTLTNLLSTLRTIPSTLRTLFSTLKTRPSTLRLLSTLRTLFSTISFLLQVLYLRLSQTIQVGDVKHSAHGGGVDSTRPSLLQAQAAEDLAESRVLGVKKVVNLL